MKISKREILARQIKKIFPRFLHEKCRACNTYIIKEDMWKRDWDEIYCLACCPNLDSVIYNQLVPRHSEFHNEFGEKKKSSMCGYCDEEIKEYNFCTINKYKFHKDCFIEIAGLKYL